MIISKPDKTKAELLKCLENLEKSFKKEIKDYNLQIIKSDDRYSIKAKKRVLFMSFYLNAEIFAGDGYVEIKYDTNVPVNKVDEVLCKVEEVLGKC